MTDTPKTQESAWLSAARPNQESTPELISAGWAPGDYVSMCCECGAMHTADKLAYYCLPCAKRILADSKKPPDTPKTAAEVMARAIYGLDWTSPYDPLPESDKDYMRERAHELVAALREAGFVVVPVEPSKEMLLVGESASDDKHDEGQDTDGRYDFWDNMEIASGVYRAMIAAAGDA